MNEKKFNKPVFKRIHVEGVYVIYRVFIDDVAVCVVYKEHRCGRWRIDGDGDINFSSRKKAVYYNQTGFLG